MFDLDLPDKNIRDLKVLFSEEEIQAKLREMAELIDNTFPADEPLYVVSVLKGSILFCCDLIRYIKTPIQLEFIKVSSYGNEFRSSGEVTVIDSKIPNLNDQNVLIVDDIVDTGHTAKHLLDMFATKYHPKMLKFASLMNKKCKREVDVEPDFYGFEIDDKFLVGYGLDYVGFYRNIPYVGWFPTDD